MRDELEVVRSLGVNDPDEQMHGFARGQAALRRERERERIETERLNGTWEPGSARARRSRLRAARRQGRRRWVLGLLIPAAIMVGGATYALTRSSVNYAAGFGCYDRVSLRADVAVPGADASNPVAACAAVWRSGAMGTLRSRTVPAQTPCVLPSGAVGVFPSGHATTCARLGLAPLPADYARTAALVTRLGSTLRGVVDPIGERCLTPGKAKAVASRELAGLGFTGWRVRLQRPLATGDRCAAIQVGEWQRTVFVFSEPRLAPPLTPGQRAFAAAHATVDASTVEVLSGDGAYAAYTGASRPGGVPCIVVLGAGTPKIVCARTRGIASLVVRLADGTVLVAGIVSHASADRGGVQLRIDQHEVAGLTVAPNGAFAGRAPSDAKGPYGRIVAVDRHGRTTANTRVLLTPISASR